MRNAPAVLLALTALNGCGEDPDVHASQMSVATHPGDFSVPGELEKAQREALKYAETTTGEPAPWYMPWSDDTITITLDTNQRVDQCFQTGPAPANTGVTPEAAASAQAEQAEYDRKTARQTQFHTIQVLAQNALTGATLQTLWPSYQHAQPGLGGIPKSLSQEVLNMEPENVLCPTAPDYILDGDKNIPVVSFAADQTHLALTPDFWGNQLTDCDRAGVLAASQLKSGRNYSTFPETNGKGTDLANMVQATVAGLCENPSRVVNEAPLSSYYGWEKGYTLNSNGDIVIRGSAKMHGKEVSGWFLMQPGNSTNCPLTGVNSKATIALDAQTSLELSFANCLPDDTKGAALVGATGRTELGADASESGNYDWYDCIQADNAGSCQKWTEYTLDASTFAWSSKVDHN